MVRLRKPHPCGGYDWQVTRLGADIGLRCLSCGRRVLLERADAGEAPEGVRLPRSSAEQVDELRTPALTRRLTPDRSRLAAQPRANRGNRFLLAQWVDLLEDDSFRRYWLMRLASHGATNALTYSLLVFTVRHSTSAIATGVLLLTLIVPSALLGAIAGVAVDRLPRGLILFVAQRAAGGAGLRC